MATSGVPFKRARLDDHEADTSATSPLAEIDHSSAVWFEDGNIILATDSLLFRVHRGILSRHSSVFADLFALPQQQGLNEMYDGIPVVRLAGDEGKDVEQLLKCIYDRPFYRSAEKPTFDVVSSTLRLSTKYAVDVIRQETITQLSTYFPTTLAQYDRSIGDLPFRDFCQPFDLLRLARETSADVLLPVLFFEAIRDTDSLWAHATNNFPDGRFILRDAILGKDRILEDLNNLLFRFINEPSPDECSNKSRCLSKKKARFVDLSFVAGLPTDPTYLLHSAEFIATWWASSICSTCLAAFKKTYDDGRQKMWEKLPEYFGLQSWEALKKDTA